MANKETAGYKTEHSYFYSLRLEGINCFKEMQTLDLSNGADDYAQWTVILGDNGTGKTTLLRVLDRMQLYENTINKNESDEFKFYEPFILTDKPKGNGVNIIDLETITNNLKENISVVLTSNSTSFSTVDFYTIFLLSYGASRRMSKSQIISSKEKNKDRITSLFDDSIELINAEEWFLQKFLKSKISDEKSKLKYDREYELVKSTLIDFLPDVNEIRIKPVNENNSKILLEVETSYGWVNLRDLSFGYQTITALLVDISSNMMEQYPASKNPLSEPVIILIDEIDLHLHPKWQRTVIEKLSHHFPKAQFIVTAHSPLIVQAAEDFNANIVVCRKEGDRVIIDNDIESVKGWRVDQILTSDLFELDSSRSKVTQELVEEYVVLKGKEKLTKEDKAKIEQLVPIVEKAYTDKKNTSDIDERLQNFAEKFLK